VTRIGFIKFSECTSLKYLNLGTPLLTDDTLIRICASNQELIELGLDNCNRLSTNGVFEACLHAKKLLKLDLEKCSIDYITLRLSLKRKERILEIKTLPDK